MSRPRGESRPAAISHTDDDILAMTVGEPTRASGPIRIVDYDPAWPSRFAREAERIRATLQARALDIVHVGSTSVPGLAAKPIIDILLTVADSADESGYLPALEGAGYRLRIREAEWHQHRLLKGPDTDVNVHVFSAGCSETERILRFRDRLRATDADRALYERTKRELAARSWRYVQNYADAKTAVIDEILVRAASGASR